MARILLDSQSVKCQWGKWRVQACKQFVTCSNMPRSRNRLTEQLARCVFFLNACLIIPTHKCMPEATFQFPFSACTVELCTPLTKFHHQPESGRRSSPCFSFDPWVDFGGVLCFRNQLTTYTQKLNFPSERWQKMQNTTCLYFLGEEQRLRGCCVTQSSSFPLCYLHWPDTRRAL